MIHKPEHRPVDAHYTPPDMAKELLSHVDWIPAGSIADFAVGGGELLIHAARRWPLRQIVACDISQKAVSAISHGQEAWSVGRCDFLSPRSRTASRVVRAEKGKVALCLANPPFSYRGSKRWSVNAADGATALCSPAVAFLLTAVEYLRPSGRLLAIVPSNSIRSQKDEGAIDLLCRAGELTILDHYPRGSFPSCTSQTLSLRFRLEKDPVQQSVRSDSERTTRFDVKLVRGCTPMHRVNPLQAGLVPVVHTSNLNNHCVYSPTCGVATSTRLVMGPAVLLPRVGRPTSGKIALYTSSNAIALSDCVFAIACSSQANALHILNSLIDNWDIFSGSYHGTCAPYLTTDDLTFALAALGIRVCTSGEQELKETVPAPPVVGANLG
jgi:predicted RNA methylase